MLSQNGQMFFNPVIFIYKKVIISVMYGKIGRHVQFVEYLKFTEKL